MLIYSKKLAYDLRLMGFEILKTIPNKDFPQYDCYVFKNSPELEEILQKKKTYSKKEDYLKINKDLFCLNLKPIELLILAQIMDEKECYETNESFAKDFSVGVSTVTRAISNLEQLGYIKTQMIKQKDGRYRLISLNLSTIESKIKLKYKMI